MKSAFLYENLFINFFRYIKQLGAFHLFDGIFVFIIFVLQRRVIGIIHVEYYKGQGNRSRSQKYEPSEQENLPLPNLT